jgi:dihydrofolate reductase
MPRRIIGGAFISLHGVARRPGARNTTGGFAHGGWLEPVFEEALAHQIDTLFAGDLALLLGRRTYEISAAFWPCMHDDDPSSTLYPQLLERDRLVLMIAPITLGGGKRLTAHQGVQ